MKPSIQQQFERVKELHARERAQRRVVTDLDEIPFSYELIGDAWLTRALCKGVPGAVVTGHTLDAPDEGTSNRRRIFLEYNEPGRRAGLPESVFCKATQSLESRYILGLNGCAHGEITFYNKIRPLLDIEAPLSYHSRIDLESLNSITLLRDLRGRVEFCDERTSVSLDMAKAQMALLASLHGRFLGSPELETVLRDYVTIEQFADMTEDAVGWSDSCHRGFLAAEAVVPAPLLARAEQLWSLTDRAFKHHAELPRTLIHNDVHLKNWYRTHDGRIGLGDWQCGVRGHWSRDLAYAISTALTPENRRAWEHELIDHYLECLAAAGVPRIPFENALLLYRQQMFPALLMWTATLVPAAGAPEMQPPATSLEFIRRIAHAIDDLDAFSSFS